VVSTEFAPRFRQPPARGKAAKINARAALPGIRFFISSTISFGRIACGWSLHSTQMDLGIFIRALI
jgi:hypothetical protein